MNKVQGLHHLALTTANIKEQIEFFTGKLGMELAALYWMHGVKNTWHVLLSKRISSMASRNNLRISSDRAFIRSGRFNVMVAMRSDFSTSNTDSVMVSPQTAAFRYLTAGRSK